MVQKSNKKTDKLTSILEEKAQQIDSMEQAVLGKEQDLVKQKNINKGLSKMMENKSEKLNPKPTQEEQEILDKAKAIRIKQRGNNGAKRKTYPDMEVEVHLVYPDDPDFDLSKARIIGAKDENGEYPYRQAIRYEYVPMKFIKHVYKVHTYALNETIYEGKPPKATFFNSNYDASFLAGLLQLRYIYSMPVERIVNYFQENGFALEKSTANGFIKRASVLLENVYKAIAKTVKESDYIAVDETYYRILVPSSKAKKDISG